MATVDWLSHLNNHTLLAPRSHLIEAHEFLGGSGEGKVAVDCACGSGRDTLYLLEKGYHVYAFDNDVTRLESLCEHPLSGANSRLVLSVSAFADFVFPRAHLINASACLFFTTPTDFAVLWQNVYKSLYKDSIFCGHFLGSETLEPGEKLPILTHSQQQLEQLFSQYYIISWKKKQEFSANLTGKKRLWLVHTIIAIKK
ncbi:hypothetical protein ABT56_07580 [Photobacterium aquae]|uniref:Tellurite resistance methyltransferase TehB-like domain-containing protein n=1 Tax=Photobacterium aquae TaxID=1195763 RepID=A0A0J1H5K1_9GAMM|nr:class I SAM-dependent methyltransferase [Photobacterium aquae]KLV06998.1 hypothetical protein ABT56_07580 [Photobacterium aquae]